MRVIDPGHLYKLDSLDGEIEQRLQFVKRIGAKYPGNEEPPYPGCTTQEVLRALIERTKYVNSQEAHVCNTLVLENLRASLKLLEIRAAERRDELQRFDDVINGVWDLGPEHEHMHMHMHIEDYPTCVTCGHIACGKHT